MGSWLATADLAILAVRDAFSDDADAVTYTPASTGVAESISAPFDPIFESVEFSDGVPYASTRPMLTLRLADITVAPLPDDLVTARGQNYLVTEVQPGGQGAAHIFLIEMV